MSLQPIKINPAPGPLPERVASWIEQAKLAAKSIDCFEYIPSCPELLDAYLSVIPGKRYCEWGSGLGIGVGLAAMQGFEATGIEIDPQLATRSRELLAQFGLDAKIVCGSYHEIVRSADVVFVYCWPGQMMAVRERFESVMPPGTWLLMADGAERFSAFFHARSDG